MVKVQYSAPAEHDLREIWQYIADDNVVAADNLINKFRSKIQNLVEYPEMGVAKPELGSNYRIYPVDNYVIFYKYQDGLVSIIRVLRASQDMGRNFL